MKLPFTDQFLLRVFDWFEALDKAYDFFAPRTMREAVCPELYELRREYSRRHARKQFNNLVYHLKKKGYIKIASLQGSHGVLLTSKGVQKALRAKCQFDTKKKRSDGKWIMIIFDIPEKKRVLRDMLRQVLIDLGYEKFQESVWVSPYDVLGNTEAFVRAYQLDIYIRVFLIDEVIKQ